MPSRAAADRPLAHPTRRLAAAVIDALILLVPCAALIYVHPLAALAAAIAYGAAFEAGERHATPGKRVCAIEVVAATGERVTVAAAMVRNAVKYGSLAFSTSVWGFVVPIAIVAPMFMPARQALDDLAARTNVLHERGLGLPTLAATVIGLLGPVLFVVALLPLILAPVTNARARESVEAALRGAAERERAVEAFAAENGRLPANPAIVLQPEGTSGRVVLTPTLEGRAVRWTCSAEGIPRGRLPARCRPQV
jgi:uncharacterized RDD family membrane protein YckC